MVSKNVLTGLAWVSIIAGLGLAGFGLYSMGFNGNPVYSIPLLVVGVVLFGVGITFYILAEKKAKQEKQSLQQSRTIRNSQRIRSEVLLPPEEREPLIPTRDRAPIIEKEVKTMDGIQKAKKVRSFPEGEKCMITKLPLERRDKILQCPSCQSHFIDRYLAEWLKQGKPCPVCKTKLKI